jgi:hypothetical protein
VQRRGLAATLEHHVRAPVAGPVPPPGLQRDRRVRAGIRVHRRETEGLRDRSPPRRRIEYDHLLRAVPLAEQGGQ